MDVIEIRAVDIRQNLIARAEAYAERTKSSLSRIGEEAVRDSKFLPKVKNGANFTVASYQKVIDWLDAAERGEAA